jgi:hypothetical protein
MLSRVYLSTAIDARLLKIQGGVRVLKKFDRPGPLFFYIVFVQISRVPKIEKVSKKFFFIKKKIFNEKNFIH